MLNEKLIILNNFRKSFKEFDSLELFLGIMGPNLVQTLNWKNFSILRLTYDCTEQVFEIQVKCTLLKPFFLYQEIKWNHFSNFRCSKNFYSSEKMSNLNMKEPPKKLFCEKKESQKEFDSIWREVSLNFFVIFRSISYTKTFWPLQKSSLLGLFWHFSEFYIVSSFLLFLFS